MLARSPVSLNSDRQAWLEAPISISSLLGGLLMSATAKPLSTNGLIMPEDFPVTEYEAIHKIIEPRSRTSADVYEQFGGAWNAVSYRFVAVVEYGAALSKSLPAGLGPEPLIRCQQERDLFGFFSNGFSVLESTFYAIFALGSFISPSAFPISTAKDQQRISPSSTADAIKRSFADDPIVKIIDTVLSDSAYLEWREVRNILTHRTAPGRTVFLNVGGDDALPEQWKIKNIPLDAKMTVTRRNELSRLLKELLVGIDRFVKSRL